MTLFEDQPEQDLRRAVALVEQTIEALGHVPGRCRQEAPGGVARFSFCRGSARISIVVGAGRGDSNGEGVIRVSAPVVVLPASVQLPAFYRRLLDLNSTDLSGVAFGIVGNDAVLLAERSVRDLDASEVDSMIRTVGRDADRFDDELAGEFETVRSSDLAEAAPDPGP